MIAFCKATATGNDFIFFDARETAFDGDLVQALQLKSRAEAVKRLCDRHFGIGADGVVFLEASGNELRWDFYNNDGSSAEMCGNASRAFVLFADHLGLSQPVRFHTRAGLVEGRVISPNRVEVTMTPPKLIEQGRPLGAHLLGDVIDSGVPHVVVEVTKLEINDALTARAQKLRYHPSLGAAGANVTFREPVTETRLKSVTFERGVENFTLSCGTGAVAAALSQALKNSQALNFEVEIPGGVVEVILDSERRSARLIGPAQILFRGQFGQGWMV